MVKKDLVEFATTDFYLAVWLICKKFRLAYVSKNEHGRNVFHLTGGSQEEAIDLANEFFNGGKIEAIKFKNVLNDLKTQIRNYEQSGKLNEVKYGEYDEGRE